MLMRFISMVITVLIKIKKQKLKNFALSFQIIRQQDSLMLILGKIEFQVQIIVKLVILLLTLQ